MTNKIYEIISIELGEPLKNIKAATKLEALVKDSIDVIGLVAALSSEFNMRIKPEELAKIKTVADIVSYIESNSQKNKNVGTLKTY